MARTGISQGTAIYWNEIATYLERRLGDPAAAADLTQDAYLRMAALPANAILLNPRAWLFQTARNLLVDHTRRVHVRRAFSESPALISETADRQPDADGILIAREQLAVLVRAVDRLPTRTREVFRLHKYEGLSYAEIAEQLGIAKNTVMVHMVKALRLCRNAVDDAEHLDDDQ